MRRRAFILCVLCSIFRVVLGWACFGIGGSLSRSRLHAADERGKKKKKHGSGPAERPTGAAISRAGRGEAAVSREGCGG